MFVLKIRRVDGSAVVTLPEEALARLRVCEGDRLILTDRKDGFRVTPYDATFVDAMKAYQETRRKYGDALRELAE